MSGLLLPKVQHLVTSGDWRASDHSLQRIDEHGIIVSDLIEQIGAAEAIEDYPNYHAGPCVLVLQTDRDGAVHVLWGMAGGTDRPAVLITAYRPDPARWNSDNRTRRT